MKKHLMICTSVLGILTSCNSINREMVDQKTDPIYANRAGETHARVVIKNAVLVKRNTRTLEENQRQLEALSKS